ncbi:YceD family protein [Thiohalorhabdus sp. Cl-TMA]|uniref:Large ribosomal RNA subunit accumulation protein YceD n=1 Tax=Thiohalorhabdus methylotrophus TaxID=3242694 RepID=A0ABV4TZS3_9GAMM
MRELRESIIRLAQVPPEGLLFQGLIPARRLTRLADAVVGMGEGVEVDLRLKPNNDAYLLHGNVRGAVELECESCRTPFRCPLAATLNLSIDPNPEQDLYRDPTQKGEVWVIDHSDEQIEAPEGYFDLVEALEDEWLLELPISPRCAEACKGICPVCGTNRNEAECACSPAPRESPFDVLAQLKKDK